MFEGPRHYFAGDVFGPVRVGKEAVDDVQIQAFAVSADDEIASSVFDDCFRWTAGWDGAHWDILTLKLATKLALIEGWTRARLTVAGACWHNVKRFNREAGATMDSSVTKSSDEHISGANGRTR
jgi:hypothetical protein